MTFAQPFQDYEILDRIGQGAMGTVFKARHRKLSRMVALKVLRPSLARDKRYVDRLRREARIVAALNHPNIVSGYDLGEEGGYHYFVMEFVEGKSLSALLNEWGSFAEDQVLDVAVQVASALDHAFQRGVIHRDVKPGNILIDEQGRVKLTDMGLAKGPADLTLTRDGSTVGTPQYISPEQAKNPQDVDVRSDLYSLGATLYHMATGQPPFKGESMAEVITKVLHEVPVAPRLLNPALGEGLALVIRKLLAKNLRVRYQTPRELLDDLERVRRSQPPAVDEHRLSAAESRPQTSALVWSLATLAGSAVIAGAIWVGMQLRGDRPAAAAPDSFVTALGAELAALPTLKAKWQRLLAAEATAPAGSGLGMEGLRNSIKAELQQAVDRTAAELQGDRWPATLRWLEEPMRWPTLVDFERERLGQPLLERTGFLAEELPPAVGDKIRSLRSDVEEKLAARDAGLLARAGYYIDVVLPARSDERCRSGDYVGAERVWTEGLRGFFDGRHEPRQETVAAAMSSQIAQRCDAAKEKALKQLAAVETARATALRTEADASLEALRARLPTDAAETLAAELGRLRDALAQVYPAPGRFPPAQDPWPDVTDKFARFEGDLEALRSRQRQARTASLIELAWRAFCGGDAGTALAILGDPARDEPDAAPLLGRHRAALQAGRTVADAIVRALRHAPLPIVGHLRSGAQAAVELSIGERDGAPQLLAKMPGGSPRLASVTEFRFGDLWQEARDADRKLLEALPADELERGRTVLAMVGDELKAATATGQLDPFLRDEVWPVIVRVRGDAGPVAVARAEVITRINEAYARARTSRELSELEAALALWTERTATDASAKERKLVDDALAWRDAEKLRQARISDVQKNAPKGADVSVADAGAGAGLEATVTLRGAALQAGAASGWHKGADDLLEICGSSQHVTEVRNNRLDLAAGLPVTALQTSCTLDLVLPPATLGQRLYVFDFRGVGFLLLVSADDNVFATTIDGDPLRDEAVHAAFLRLLAGVVFPEAKSASTGEGGKRVRVLPGAVHRLQLRVDATANREHASAGVSLDLFELCSDQVKLDPQRPPTLTVYPLQDLSVRAAKFVAERF